MAAADKGSRILREWNEQRQREKLIAQRNHANMRRNWWAGVVGAGAGSGFAGGGVNRLTASLAQWSQSVNADLDGALVIMRARARQLTANNEFGRRFLSLVAANVVGATGPTLQVRAAMQSGALDKVANDAIEMEYAKWCRRADVRGLMDFAHLQRIGITSVARDGEVLIRLVQERSLPNGIGLQLLEADRLDEEYNVRLQSSNVVRQGVELNALMQPVAFYIKSAHPGENYGGPAQTRERVPAEQVLHVFLPTRPEQVRGYTWFHAVLLRMQMMAAYEEAAVVAARVGAAKMGVFKRDPESASTLEALADGVDARGVPQMSGEPGEFMELPPGYELQNWSPEYPTENYSDFLKACYRGIASGLDVAAHNLTGDMESVNYSSARIAEMTERDQWEQLQAWWVRAVTLPVYQRWLASALLRGDIRFPQSGKALPATTYAKFADVSRFQCRRWKWVDPQKEIEALAKEIEIGLNSRTAAAAAQGREFEDIVDELKQEKQLMADLNPPPPAPAKPAGDDADETEESEETDDAD